MREISLAEARAIDNLFEAGDRDDSRKNNYIKVLSDVERRQRLLDQITTVLIENKQRLDTKQLLNAVRVFGS